jgi:hypothetical protein
MNTESAAPGTLTEAIGAGDVDCAAGFYDRAAGRVWETCAELCGPELANEATMAAFIGFLSRLHDRSAPEDATELLRRATRTASASRIRGSTWQPPACQAASELIAADANGELCRDAESLRRHVGDCKRCRETADLLAQVGRMDDRSGESSPAEHVREAWLELVGTRNAEAQAAPEPPEADEPPALEIEQQPAPPDPSDAHRPAPESEAQPAPPAPVRVRVRARDGGLVRVARRIVSSNRRR